VVQSRLTPSPRRSAALCGPDPSSDLGLIIDQSCGGRILPRRVPARRSSASCRPNASRTRGSKLAGLRPRSVPDRQVRTNDSARRAKFAMSGAPAQLLPDQSDHRRRGRRQRRPDPGARTDVLLVGEVRLSPNPGPPTRAWSEVPRQCPGSGHRKPMSQDIGNWCVGS
jgi:hypothetical protein